MVYVTHHGDNRSTGFEIFGSVGFLSNGFLHVGRNIFGLESELFGHEVDGLSVHTLVDADHDADTHARSDDFRHRHVHHLCELVGRHEFRKFKHFAFGFGFAAFFFFALVDLFALFLAVLGTLSTFLLAGEACECFLYLLCYVFFRDFGLCIFLCTAVAVVGTLASTLVVAALAVVALVLAAVVAGVAGRLVGSIVHVNAFVADAGTFLTLAVLTLCIARSVS